MKTESCLVCNKKIAGRSDKKFCSNACKNKYHNSVNRLPLELLKGVNEVLKNNYKVLFSVYKGRTVKVSKKAIEGQGFDFKFFTHDFMNNKGERYLYCYDLGYLLLENDMVLVVKSTLKIL